MKQTIACFDLDGTLLDTLEDLAAAANLTLARHHYAEHPVAAYRHFVGNGIETLVRRALPHNAPAQHDPAEFAAVMTTMRAAYAGTTCSHTRPYPGIAELLAVLREQGTKTAVLTNKPHLAALEVIRHYFPEHHFVAVYGARAGKELKPHPQIAFELAAELGCTPETMVYLGDSDVDMHFARAAGMRPVGAGWGFRGAEELQAAGACTVCTQPGELLQCL